MNTHRHRQHQLDQQDGPAARCPVLAVQDDSGDGPHEPAFLPAASTSNLSHAVMVWRTIYRVMECGCQCRRRLLPSPPPWRQLFFAFFLMWATAARGEEMGPTSIDEEGNVEQLAKSDDDGLAVLTQGSCVGCMLIQFAGILITAWRVGARRHREI